MRTCEQLVLLLEGVSFIISRLVSYSANHTQKAGSLAAAVVTARHSGLLYRQFMMYRSPLLSAQIVEAEPGLTEVGVSESHLVIVHLGAPVRAYCRIDGADGGPRLQRRGDIDIVPVGSLGSWSDEAPARLLALRFSPDIRGFTDNGLARMRVVPHLQVRDETLSPLILALERELEYGRREDLFVDGLGLAIGSRLIRRFGENQAQEGVSGLAHYRLSRVQAFIEANLDRSLRLADLAQVAGLGVSRFNAAFRFSVGMSPHQYVTARRVERAKGMILASTAPLCEIALACGFSSQSHMTQRMSEHLGVTPGRLRAGVSQAPYRHPSRSQ